MTLLQLVCASLCETGEMLSASAGAADKDDDEDDITSAVTEMLRDIDFDVIRNDKQLLMAGEVPGKSIRHKY